MRKFTANIKKELLLLTRDRGGLAVLFVMPAVLIVIMALIQDAPFRDYQELNIPMVLVNNDSGFVGRELTHGLKNSGMFNVHQENDRKKGQQELEEGVIDILVIIDQNATAGFNARLDHFIGTAMNTGDTIQSTPLPGVVEVKFAPDIKKSFRLTVMSALEQYTSAMVASKLYESLSTEMNGTTGDTPDAMPVFLDFNAGAKAADSKPSFELNSVQHNVPAWTIFGMFFIVISLSGSMIKERQEGSYLRILTMPGGYNVVLLGKIAAYILVCLLQSMVMLGVGKFLLPAFGLPDLVVGTSAGALLVMLLTTALAATGLGILTGTLFNTFQQSSTFGAVLVVILAALGGIWIPVYIMPGALQTLAEISPLYWALTGIQKVFLLSGSFGAIWSDALKLFLFFAVCMLFSYFRNKTRSL